MPDKDFLEQASKFHSQFMVTKGVKLFKYQAGCAIDERTWVYFEYEDGSSFKYTGPVQQPVSELVSHLWSSFTKFRID